MKRTKGNPYVLADAIHNLNVTVSMLLELIQSPAFTHGQKKGFAINIEHLLNKFEMDWVEFSSDNEIPF
jgi:hypothetical protein